MRVFILFILLWGLACWAAVPSKQKAPDNFRNLELQVYALQDRIGKLEKLVERHKRADEQVLIDLIKRTNFINERLAKLEKR